jgi:hypothetical protein
MERAAGASLAAGADPGVAVKRSGAASSTAGWGTLSVSRVEDSPSVGLATVGETAGGMTAAAGALSGTEMDWTWGTATGGGGTKRLVRTKPPSRLGSEAGFARASSSSDCGAVSSLLKPAGSAMSGVRAASRASKPVTPDPAGRVPCAAGWAGAVGMTELTTGGIMKLDGSVEHIDVA